MSEAAAILFAIVTGLVIAFQLALAAGAPWGDYAMGGAFSGRMPAPMRAAAVVQAAVLAGIAVVVLSGAGLLIPSLVESTPWLVWVPVALSGVAVLLNAATRSAGEKRLWLPVTIVLLTTSVLVAIT
jgi:hypothetical protein